MLVSSTVLRALAGAYFEIAVISTEDEAHFVTSNGDHQARMLFSQLSGRMSLPIEPAWLATGVFPTPESKAPGARTQELRTLSITFASWAMAGSALPGAPVPS